MDIRIKAAILITLVTAILAISLASDMEADSDDVHGTIMGFDKNITTENKVAAYYYKNSDTTGQDWMVFKLIGRLPWDFTILITNHGSGTSDTFGPRSVSMTSTDEDFMIRMPTANGKSGNLLYGYTYRIDITPKDGSDTISMYMKIKEQCRVTYDFNGGNGPSIFEEYVIQNTTIGLLTPALSYYGNFTSPLDDQLVFAGWSTDPHSSTLVNYQNNTTSYKITQDVNLYAVWKYTVSYNGNGGNGTVPDNDFYYNVPATLPSSGFTMSNCTFAGWSPSQNAAISYVGGAQSNIGIFDRLNIQNGQATAYAIYKTDYAFIDPSNSHHISDMTVYMNGSGPLESYFWPEYSDGAVAYQRFIGWNTGPDDTISQYEPGSAFVFNDAPHSSDGQNTLYAIWQYEVFTLTITGNDIITKVISNSNDTSVVNDSDFVEVYGSREVGVINSSTIIIKPNEHSPYGIGNIYAVSDGSLQNVKTENSGVVDVDVSLGTYTITNFKSSTVLSISPERTYYVKALWTSIDGAAPTKLSENSNEYIIAHYGSAITAGSSGTLIMETIKPCKILDVRMFDASSTTNGNFERKQSNALEKITDESYLIDYSTARYDCVLLITLESVEPTYEVFVSQMNEDGEIIVKIQSDNNTSVSIGSRISLGGTYYTKENIPGLGTYNVYGNISDLGLEPFIVTEPSVMQYSFDLGEITPYWIYACYEDADSDESYQSLGVLVMKKVKLTMATQTDISYIVNNRSYSAPLSFYPGDVVTISATSSNNHISGWKISFDGTEYSTLTDELDANGYYSFVIVKDVFLRPTFETDTNP